MSTALEREIPSPDRDTLLAEAEAIIREAVAHRRGKMGVEGAIHDVGTVFGIGPFVARKLLYGEKLGISTDRYLRLKLARVIEGRRRVIELEMAAQAERERTAQHEAELRGALRTWGLFSGVVAEISRALLGLGRWPQPAAATPAPTDGVLDTSG